jgi:O-antigen ligase
LNGAALRGAGAALALGLAGIAAGAAWTVAATKAGGVGNAPVLLLALALAPAVTLAVVGHRLAGVILVLVVFPVGSVHVPTPGVETQLVELTVFLVTALVVLRRLSLGEKPLEWAPPLWWALGLLAWAIVCTPSAVDHGLALKQDAVLAAGIVFAAVLLSTLRGVDDVRAMLGILLAVAVGIAAAALSQPVQFQATSAGETVGGRLQGAFDHPNQLGLFCALSAMIATGMSFGARSRPARIASALALPVVLGALLFSLSRGAWIGTSLGFLYLLIVLREARRALVIVGIPFVIAGALFGSFAPGGTDIEVVTLRAHALTTLSPYDARPAIYREALREIKASPITGVGPGNFPVASERAGSESSTVFADHAHDLWLTWAAEDGLPAFALIVAFTIALGLAAGRASREASRRGERRDRAVIAGLTAALIAVLGQGIFDYLLRNAVLWILVWGLIGALLVCAREYGAFGPPRQPVR